MNNWAIKENEQSSEITLNTTTIELITHKIERMNLETNERTLLDKPRQSLVIRGFDSGEYVEFIITGDFKMEEKHVKPRTTIPDDNIYFNYEI